MSGTRLAMAVTVAAVLASMWAGTAWGQSSTERARSAAKSAGKPAAGHAESKKDDGPKGGAASKKEAKEDEKPAKSEAAVQALFEVGFTEAELGKRPEVGDYPEKGPSVRLSNLLLDDECTAVVEKFKDSVSEKTVGTGPVLVLTGQEGKGYASAWLSLPSDRWIARGKVRVELDVMMASSSVAGHVDISAKGAAVDDVAIVRMHMGGSTVLMNPTNNSASEDTTYTTRGNPYRLTWDIDLDEGKQVLRVNGGMPLEGEIKKGRITGLTIRVHPGMRAAVDNIRYGPVKLP